MVGDNLPAPVPPQDDPAFDEARRRWLAALAESTLKFRRNATDAVDELLVEMIGQQKDTGFNKFTTPNGRNCIVIIGVGDEPVGKLTDVIYYLTHPEENREEQKDSD